MLRFKQFFVCRSVLLVTTKSHLHFYKNLNRHLDIGDGTPRHLVWIPSFSYNFLTNLWNMILWVLWYYEYLCAKMCFVTIFPFNIFLSVGTGDRPMRAAGFTPIPLSSIVIRWPSAARMFYDQSRPSPA